MNTGAVQQVEYSKTKSQPTQRAADRPVGATATALVSVALIIRFLDLPAAYGRLYRNGSILMLIAGALVVGLGLTAIEPLPLLLALSALLLAPVVYGILIWVKVFEAREMEM